MSGRLGADPAHEADALAELFLGEETAPDAPADVLTRAPVDLVVLGHLPVLAGAWLGPHARATTEEMGCPVALVRLRHGHASVEIFGASASPRDDFESALNAAADVAGAWIVCADGETASAARACGAGGITILSGADEAAVVACYRAVKALSSEPNIPPVRVVITGAGPESRAREAAARLEKAAQSYLPIGVTVEVRQRSIDAGPSCVVHRGEWTGSAASLLEHIFEASESANPRAALEPPPRAQQPVATAPPVAPSLAATDETSGCPLPAGMAALPWRCPRARRAIIARRADGRLCVIAHDHPTHDVGSLLLTARAWALDNLGLIADASASKCGPITGPVSMHVVSEAPARVRALADAGVTVHALARASDGAWAMIAISDAGE